VSSRHAQLTSQGDTLMIQDLGSRNGTFLNGQKIGPQPVPVAQGATIAFGDKGPKITVQFGPSGPGKKTRMIQDLQGELEGAKAGLTKEKSARSTGRMVACCAILVVVLAGGGVAGFLYWKGGKNTLLAKIETASTGLKTTREQASQRGLTDYAKDDWKKVDADEFAAQEAQKKGDLAKAAELFALASTEATQAMSKAGDEQLKVEKDRASQMQHDFEDAKKKADAEQAAKDADLQKQKDKEAEERQKALAAASGDAKKTLDAAAKAAESRNPKDVEEAAKALEEALKKNPDDPTLKAKLDELKKKLTEMQGLEGVAKTARKSVVLVLSQTFAIPAGQREDTTQIRAPISEGAGTGVFVTKDRILTAKEVVEPWKFDPKALATATKLQEKNWQVRTRLEVWQLDDKGIFQVAWKADSGAVTVKRRGDDVTGDEQKVSIPFDNQTVEVAVKPHKRDESAYVLLEVKDGNAPFVGLADKDPAKGDKVLMMGQQRGVQGLKPGEAGLFWLQAELKEPGDRPAIAGGSFSTWLGGPVVDGNGKLLGVIVETGKESRAISRAKLKTE
jgi:pSer/pThr/pTyr-binding forkhead associated (FHA) protein